jgi:hypothetical protein
VKARAFDDVAVAFELALVETLLLPLELVPPAALVDVPDPPAEPDVLTLLGTNVMGTLRFWVRESPNPISQPTPVVTSEGHGYFCASTDDWFPAVSFPDRGGPTVPSTTWNARDMVPVGLTVARYGIGFEQLTSRGFPAREIVGCPGARLHSETDPVAPGVNPLPVTVTGVPFFTHVAGLTVTLSPPEETVFGAGMHGAVVVVVGGTVVVGMGTLDANANGRGVATPPRLSNAKNAQPPV